MKKYLLRISGLASLALLLHGSGFAQEDSKREKDTDRPHRYDEIIIKHKSDKDAKVTIEIKDGEVLVDGKPISDYDDSTLSIHRQKIMGYGKNSFSYGFSRDMLSAPDGDDMAILAPNGSHGGAWSYSGNDKLFQPNRALLGVSSEKVATGEGARVIEVTKGSAAEKLGLRSGDIITKVDETAITDPKSLSAAIGEHHPDDKITLTYTRDGKQQKETVVLGKTKTMLVEPFNFKFDNLPDLKEFRSDGMPRAFNEYYGNSMKFGVRAQDMDEGKGVKVLEVDDESTAAKAGIKEGDIITRFDGKEINSVTALTEAAHAAKEKVSVKVGLIRDGKAQEVEVKVPKRLRTADL
ncbi:MAG TPA: PDZ domain-containing protein [Puia sp.]|jgi:serine protease Do|nr:PDZ domain-containing protein [Puia sp.]